MPWCHAFVSVSARWGVIFIGLWLVLVPRPGSAAEGFTAPPGTSAIVGGVSAEEDELDAVVLLKTRAGHCSGTLIAPRLVLTAAHCLDDDSAHAGITVGFGPRGTTDSMLAQSFGLHPQFCEPCEEDAYDFAYVVLPRDYEPAGGYLRVLTDPREWDETMHAGNVVLLAGYGNDDPFLEHASTPLKRKVTTTMTEFSDHGTEFYAGGRQRDTCRGDSGGAAIVPLGRGAYRLAGVTSRGPKPCGRGGWYGVAYYALPWVQTLTGTRLLPLGCHRGDCLDLDMDADEAPGCHLGERPRRGAWTVMLWFLVRRRRRRHDS
ncbi:MAG: S1 family peptidase [Myxococcota bacterium]